MGLSVTQCHDFGRMWEGDAEIMMKIVWTRATREKQQRA